MREVILYGKLRKRFGRSFMLDVSSPAEAIKALSAVVPGFKAWFSREAQAGSGYHVFIDKRNIGEDEVQHPAERNAAIRIAPAIQGAKRGGLFKLILGAILMVASIWFPPLLGAGIAMALGGISEMLSPQPKTPSSSNREAVGQLNPSHVFNGSVNTQAQGHPVPLLFGRMRVGSAVVSAGITTEQIAV